MPAKPKYHLRPNGLMETTRTDPHTHKRIHFYGYTAREIDAQIMEYTSKQETGLLFKAVAEDWWNAHSSTLAPNSLKNYKPAYRRAVDEFGDTPIRQIAPRDIKRFITAFSRGDRARKTVSTQLLVCNLIFSYAVECGALDISPSTHIKVPANLPASHREAASETDEAIIKRSAHVWLLPTLILYTGLRRGEALALTWGDIDLDAGVIHVTKSLYHEGDRPKIKAPKTASSVRTVPLLQPLRDALPPFGEAGDYIFSRNGGSTPLTNRQYQTLWSHYVSATGITCTAHQLRHSYATMLYECDIDVKEAQDLLGHSTVAMTMDVYTHLRAARRQQTIDKLNHKLQNVV